MPLDPYETLLVAEQLRLMEGTVNDFVTRCEASRRQRGDDQRTVIFFPGGMASELARADQRFDRPPVGGFTYQTAWFDAAAVWLMESALNLQMAGRRDSGNRLIVADGPLTNCLETPYGDFFDWCAQSGLDVLPVGWDFRRSGAWNTAFFLDHLVPYVQARTNHDPFARATMVGHSFGGMLVKWILNDHARPFCQTLQHAITVGTPFYGYPGQTERLFRSERLLGPRYNLAEITLAMATMPGGYTLFFLDGDTYDANAAALAADPYPLLDYPSKDAANASLRVDPYVFQASQPGNSNLCRYPIRGRQPAWPWFESYLAAGRTEYQAVAKPLDASVSDKLHCIRGVQTRDDRVIDETPGRQRWGWFDVRRKLIDQPDVVQSHDEDCLMPGDGVQPAWTARLVTQPAGNIHTIEDQADDARGGLKHGALMDHRRVRATLQQLIKPGVAFLEVDLKVRPAGPDEFDRAVAEIRRIAALPSPAERRRAFDAYLRELGPQRSAELMKRWFIELPRGAEAGVGMR